MSSKYISVVKSPEKDETITLKIKSVNRSPVISFTIAADVTKEKCEQETAQEIQTAIDAELALLDYDYNGMPAFNSEGSPPPLTFRTVKTEHVINIWSQGSFELSIQQPAPVTLLSVGDIPTLTTVPTANKYEAYLPGNFALLEDEDKVGPLELASAFLVSSMFGFPIVSATYLDTLRGNNRLGFSLDVFPVVQNDPMYIKGPYGVSVLSLQNDTAAFTQFDIDEYGVGSFRDYGPYRKGPMDKNNIGKISYVAGYDSIPLIVVQQLMRSVQFVNIPVGVSGTLKAGSFTMNIPDALALQGEIRFTINSALGRP